MPSRKRQLGIVDPLSLFGLGFLILTLIVGTKVVNNPNSSFNPFKKASCISCPGDTCPDGWIYGDDSCAPQASCEQRHQEACANHQATVTQENTSSPSAKSAVAIIQQQAAARAKMKDRLPVEGSAEPVQPRPKTQMELGSAVLPTQEPVAPTPLKASPTVGSVILPVRGGIIVKTIAGRIPLPVTD